MSDFGLKGAKERAPYFWLDQKESTKGSSFPFCCKWSLEPFCSCAVHLGGCDLLLAKITPRDSWAHSPVWQLDRDRFVLLGLPAQIRLGSTGLYGVKEARLPWAEDHQQAEWYSTRGFVLWGLEAGDSTKRSGFGCQKTFREPFWCSMTQFPHLWKGHSTVDLCKRLWAQQPREFGVTVLAVVLALMERGPGHYIHPMHFYVLLCMLLPWRGGMSSHCSQLEAFMLKLCGWWWIPRDRGEITAGHGVPSVKFLLNLFEWLNAVVIVWFCQPGVLGKVKTVLKITKNWRQLVGTAMWKSRSLANVSCEKGLKEIGFFFSLEKRWMTVYMVTRCIQVKDCCRVKMNKFFSLSMAGTMRN